MSYYYVRGGTRDLAKGNGTDNRSLAISSSEAAASS